MHKLNVKYCLYNGIPQSTELSVFTVYCNYLNFLKNTNKPSHASVMLKSGLIRYFIPFVGKVSNGEICITACSDKAEIETLKQLPSTLITEISTIAEQAFIDLEVPKSNRRPYRSVLKAFVLWATQCGYCSAQIEKEVKLNQFRSPVGSEKGTFRRKGGHKLKQKATYSLGAKIVRGSERGKPYFPDDYINQYLAEDLESYKNFRASSCTSKTMFMEHRCILSTLGWLHRYKHIPLEDLRLTSIIEFYPLNTSLSVCLDDSGKPDMNCYLLKKALLREQAFEKSFVTESLAVEYTNFVAGHPSTQILRIGVWTAIAKFVYRNEVGSQDYPEYRDIPIIRKLERLQGTLRAKERITPDVVPHHKKSIAWEQALEVVEKLRQRVEISHCYYPRKELKRIGRSPIKRARRIGALATDLQNFLSVAFAVLMPPDRSRTYYELEIGKTFVSGFFDGSRFVPEDKMKDKSKTKHYIHLGANDYKTGKIYGEWWGEIPNVEFADGKTLYGYIYQWLTWGRELKQELNHNFFFVGIIHRRQVQQGEWSERFIRIFDREVGVPVSPKELRKMYVTYLKNSGASEAVLEAAACSMHHSRRMQTNIYDQQEQMKKMAPALEFNKGIFAKVFSKT